VDRVATRFAELQQALDLSFDDFIRTSSDPRHSPGVAKLWAACADSGDLYQKSYTGRYCVGCEAFYADGDLVDGRCPEHETPVEIVEETNWFFRLSRYQERLRAAVATDELRIEPATRKHEVLSFIESGLADFSVSRSVARARGWGIPVPGDPGQVVYVWFDALGNYITAPGYGTDDDGFDHWWAGSDERVHVIGKGIIRFHAVYWPAMLLSAGLRLPDTIFVHEYLTSGGRKISKSAGNADDPAEIAARFGADALRWAGGCCARWPGPVTRITRPSAWSRGPTRTWPTTSATWSTAQCPWCAATATASYPRRVQSGHESARRTRSTRRWRTSTSAG